MIDAYLAVVGTWPFRLVALLVTVTMAMTLSIQGKPLQPPGIFSLELAFTDRDAQKVVDSWKAPDLKRTAYWQVLLDFIFIAGYASLLVAVALSSQRAANAAGLAWLSYLAGLGIYGGLAAGILDCLENLGMLAMLAGWINTPIAFATSTVSSAKWALVVIIPLIAIATFVMA